MKPANCPESTCHKPRREEGGRGGREVGGGGDGGEGGKEGRNDARKIGNRTENESRAVVVEEQPYNELH